MRLHSLVVFISACCVTACLPLAGEPAQPQHTVVLSARGNAAPTFGRPLSLEVSYQNQSDQSWLLRRPEESGSTRFHCQMVGSDRSTAGYRLGKSPVKPPPLPNGGDILEEVVGGPLEILPGKRHEFVITLEPSWTGNVVPGVWDVWIGDRRERQQSNRLRIPLRFTRDSIVACLEVVEDPKQGRSKREWHAAWLEKVMPELTLQWWAPIATPEEREASEAEIGRRLGNFRTFLRDPENAEAIQQAIALINQEAGLPPVADEKPAETPTPEAGDKGGK